MSTDALAAPAAARMIIVSGLSGSGKSIALQTLEDLGYYCVDNLPIGLLTPFANALLTRDDGKTTATAIGIDARNFLDQLSCFPSALDELRRLGFAVDVLFLHASDDALVRRYSATRRRHPLSHDGGLPLVDAIRRERQLVDAIRAHATLTIDSSQTTLYDLRDAVRQRLHDALPDSLTLLFESFGFKNGVPADADLVFDVRCLPNPHWEPELQKLTGLNAAVGEFLERHDDVGQMLADIERFLTTWIPKFDTGSRGYLTTAIGCTGGQHRSVYIVEQLRKRFSGNERQIQTRHRELGR